MTGAHATCSARRRPSAWGPPRGRISPAPSAHGWSPPTSWPMRARANGYDLAMTASVNGAELSRGPWADAQFGFGEMVARASADVRLRPGDLLGSGTVGTGCLLEIKDESLSRWLQPGDERHARGRTAGIADHAHRRTAGGPMTTATGVDAIASGWHAVQRRLADHAARPLPTALTDPDPGDEERWEAGQVWAHLAEFPAYWLDQVRARAGAHPTAGPTEPAFGRTKADEGRLGGDRARAAHRSGRAAAPGVGAARRGVDRARRAPRSRRGRCSACIRPAAPCRSPRSSIASSSTTWRSMPTSSTGWSW